MTTEVGVLTLNENPSFLAPFTKAPSSVNTTALALQFLCSTDLASNSLAFEVYARLPYAQPVMYNFFLPCKP